MSNQMSEIESLNLLGNKEFAYCIDRRICPIVIDFKMMSLDEAMKLRDWLTKAVNIAKEIPGRESKEQTV